ncbi:unnamed protein product, partial [Darwinula stevensoni]
WCIHASEIYVSSRGGLRCIFLTSILSNERHHPGVHSATERWSVKDGVKTVELFVRTKSFVETQRAFERELDRSDAPSDETITAWASKRRETGSVRDVQPPGLPRSVRTPVAVATVPAAVRRSPRRSTRRSAQTVGAERTSVVRILHERLHSHPYELQVVQAIRDDDERARVQFCTEFLHTVQGDPQIPEMPLYGAARMKELSVPSQSMGRSKSESSVAEPIQMDPNSTLSLRADAESDPGRAASEPDLSAMDAEETPGCEFRSCDPRSESRERIQRSSSPPSGSQESSRPADFNTGNGKLRSVLAADEECLPGALSENVEETTGARIDEFGKEEERQGPPSRQ